nr:hypothetical protein [Betaproteobacteria bacterium]
MKPAKAVRHTLNRKKHKNALTETFGQRVFHCEIEKPSGDSFAREHLFQDTAANRFIAQQSRSLPPSRLLHGLAS